jgi:hypothetical protein
MGVHKIERMASAFVDFQDKRLGMLTSSVVLLHNNVCPHTTARTQTFQLEVV